ncbi:MAG: hypothetical protein HQ463_01065 [Bacteroidetes bacterium]|nr:hypothetical protein [Bacteroidota bacterium]
MNEKLIISEQKTELLNLFLGDEIYLINEPKYYDSIDSEGGNKYRFLNIVMHTATEIIAPESKDFFFKMANAIQNERINMDADGFAVINISNYPGLTWQNLEKLFSPKFCIFWGVDPFTLNIQCHLNKGLMHNGCKIISVESMEIVKDNLEMKKKLWAMVQRMFEMIKK